MAIWVINAFHNLKCMVNAYPYFFLLVDYTISPIVYKHLWQSLFLWLTLVLAKLYAFHALDSIYPPPPVHLSLIPIMPFRILSLK